MRLILDKLLKNKKSNPKIRNLRLRNRKNKRNRNNRNKKQLRNLLLITGLSHNFLL